MKSSSVLSEEERDVSGVGALHDELWTEKKRPTVKTEIQLLALRKKKEERKKE